jgi:hypothetical protein
MLLVLEIMLTMTAWRKGYKGYALIPVGLVFLTGVLIGLSNPGADALSVIWIDILAIVVLSVMIAVAKTPADKDAKETMEPDTHFSEQDGRKELAASQQETEFN